MSKAKGKAGTQLFSPHIHSPFTVARLMWDVVIALIPAGLVSVYFFGYNSLMIIGISLATGVVTELLMNLFTKSEVTVLDGSVVITALLFAYNLPPSTPWYVVVAGCFFAVAIVKWSFGGLGYNFMNPALGGRIFVLAAWPSVMVNHWSPTIPAYIQNNPIVNTNIIETISVVTNGYIPQSVTNAITNFTTNFYAFQEASSKIIGLDAISTASPLNTLKMGGWQAVGEAGFNYLDLFLGNIPGCIGETSALALLIGFIYLMVRKVIFPDVPVIYIGTVALLSWIFGGLPHGTGFFTGDALYHILSGGLMLGALYMANDIVTSPLKLKGNAIYAVLLGILTVIIRLWGGYPEGVSYAIVFMNIFVPLIDKYTNGKIYGRVKVKKTAQ